MKTVQLLDVGDKVNIEMEIAKRYFEDNGEIRYILKDPRRLGRLVDYPFSNEDLKLVEREEEANGTMATLP